MTIDVKPSLPITSDSQRTDPLVKALVLTFKLHGIDVSEEAFMQGIPPSGKDGRFVANDLIRAADAQDALVILKERSLAQISELILPVILVLKDGHAAVLKRKLSDGRFALCFSDTGVEEIVFDADRLISNYSGYCLFVRPPRGESARGRENQSVGQADRRGSDGNLGDILEQRQSGHWFWATIWRFRGYYVEVAVATVLINVLALAGTFFTMNVYDRVVPNLAFVTLWTLGIGVSIAMGFEFIARNLRAWLLDNAGKKADLLLGSALFRQTLQIRLEYRSASPGAYANNLKEFESLRDFVTSVTLATLADLPFLILFIAVIGMIAGPIMWVPIFAVPIILSATLLVQIPLAKLVNENLRESSLKHGALVEAVEGIETIKALRAESWLQRQYEVSSALTARSSMKTRLYSNLVIHFCMSLQLFATVAAVVVGVYQIAEGKLTMGALIGAVMLIGRALAPVSQITSLGIRFQQARSALKNLNRIMAQPTDRERGKSYLHKSNFQGELKAQGLNYKYGEDGPLVVKGVDLHIRAGERAVILGRIGSGKSTLLKVLSGLYKPGAGQVSLDSLDIAQIEPNVVRHHLAFVGQEARLLHGTLRQNLMVANPQASDDWMLRVAEAVGVAEIARAHPRGYDMLINERGEGISGGQRQAVAIARALISRPSVILLDEPTSAMDQISEQRALNAILELSPGRTVVMVTHKMSILSFAQRLIVLEAGQKVADGPRQAVIDALNAGQVKAAERKTDTALASAT
jgi:ATP-binding cassette, subfamily C, bacterial LapB